MSENMCCPCNPNQLYLNCCYPFHKGITTPKTAEQLMRSRYSAYALNLFAYINKTWHPTTCPNALMSEEKEINWIKLIINRAWNSEKNNEAFVDFDAFYEMNGQLNKMHETSRFNKIDQQWYYVDGKVS